VRGLERSFPRTGQGWNLMQGWFGIEFEPRAGDDNVVEALHHFDQLQHVGARFRVPLGIKRALPAIDDTARWAARLDTC
jgi:hypothetical protein